jgi:hypothetical protein
MTNQHPITPSPELALQWINEYLNEHPEGVDVEVLVVNAAQWGADQELEACCHYFARDLRESLALELRAARRPKPSSLKEQALALLNKAEDPSWDINDFSIVRRALEQLDD